VWLKILKDSKSPKYTKAINCLAAIKSHKAVPALLEIATGLKGGQDQDRWMAVRALGAIGDQSVVPRLIHLIYHPNQGVRFWTQISLVRLTHENLEANWQAWGTWWDKQAKAPAFSAVKIVWTTNPDLADPDQQGQQDKQLIEKLSGRKRSTFKAATQPVVLQTSPQTYANNVPSSLDTLTVLFDQAMMNNSWSPTGGGDTLPNIVGDPAYDRSRTTWSCPVQLQPGKVYWLGVNSPNFQNFKSSRRVPAQRYVILFATATADGQPTEISPQFLSQAKRINNLSQAMDSTAPSSKPGELALDDGKSAGKMSLGGSGHVVRLDPGEGDTLQAIRIYGSRYGATRAPAEAFHVYLCDADFHVVKDFPFPYARFRKGTPRWVTLKVDATPLPDPCLLCVDFNPGSTKGVYVHHDQQPSNQSYSAIPGQPLKRFSKGDWLIRAVIK
jgi:hypothetical protein